MKNEIWKADPATYKQRFILFTLTKEDYREKNITKGEAYDLIASLSNGKEKKISKVNNDLVGDIVKFLKGNDDKIIAKINEQLGIKSVIVNDIDHTDKKTFMFFGSGCGFSWIEYDKRSKIGKKLFEGRKSDFYLAIAQYKNYIKGKISPKVVSYLSSMGSPIEAVLGQNMEINAEIMAIALGYVIDKYNLKRVWLRTRLD